MISAYLAKLRSPMTASLSQSPVVHITSRQGVSPLAQFNSQLGSYSLLTVSTDVPMARHMDVRAHACTISSGTIYAELPDP